MRAGGACFLGVTLLVASGGRAAEAEGPPRIVLISTAGTDLGNRLRAEAAAIGIDLVSDPAARMDELPSEIAARNGAAGVVRISSSSSATLYLPSRRDTSPQYEGFNADLQAGDSFALRLVEEMRSRLVDLGISPRDESEPPIAAAAQASNASPAGPTGVTRPMSAADEPTAVIRASKSTAASNERRTQLEFSGGVATVAANGGLGASLHGVAALRLRRPSDWGATIQGLFPLAANDFSATEGRGRVRLGLVTAQIDRLLWRAPRWSVAGNGGAGVLILALSGTPATGFVGKNDHLVVAVAFAGVEAAVDVFSWLAVRGGPTLGITASRPVIRFDGHEVAAWGRPFVLGAVALDFRVPIGTVGRRP